MSVLLTAAPTALSKEFKTARGFLALKPGEKATYEIILPGQPESPLTREGRPMPLRRTLTNSVRIGTYLIYDTEAEADVAMAYTKGTRPIEASGGGQAIIPNVQEVVFTAVSGGRMVVDSTSRNLFEFLEFHPLNASTLGGNASNEPMFRRVLPAKTAEKQINFDDRVTEARMAVRAASTKDKEFMAELLRLDPALDGPEKDATAHRLTAALTEIANRQPDAILSANRSEAARASQLVRDLDTYEQARFNPEKSMWEMSNGDQLGPALQSGANAAQELARWFQFSPVGVEKAKSLSKGIDALKAGAGRKR